MYFYENSSDESFETDTAEEEIEIYSLVKRGGEPKGGDRSG